MADNTKKASVFEFVQQSEQFNKEMPSALNPFLRRKCYKLPPKVVKGMRMLPEMKQTLSGPTFRIPAGMTREEVKTFKLTFGQYLKSADISFDMDDDDEDRESDFHATFQTSDIDLLIETEQVFEEECGLDMSDENNVWVTKDAQTKRLLSAKDEKEQGIEVSTPQKNLKFKSVPSHTDKNVDEFRRSFAPIALKAGIKFDVLKDDSTKPPTWKTACIAKNNRVMEKALTAYQTKQQKLEQNRAEVEAKKDERPSLLARIAEAKREAREQQIARQKENALDNRTQGAIQR